MNLSPTSRTLFFIQIGTVVAGIIVIACQCLYVSAYPKSPEADSLSGISIATLILALVSTLATTVLALRQKAGRTIKAWIEGVWCGFMTAFWILASVGGIAKPANDMRNITCKVLPNGKDTDDANFKRACQASFASTAFCIVSALLFIATCGLLITFAIQRKIREKEAAKVKVGGHYTLAPSPSQYRRAEQAAKDEEEAQEGKSHSHTEAETSGATAAELQPLEEHTSSIELPENVYQDPVTTTPPVAASTPITSPAAVTSPAPAPTTSTLTPGQPLYHHQQYSSQGSGHHYPAGSESGGAGGQQHMPYSSYPSNTGYGYNNNNNNNDVYNTINSNPNNAYLSSHVGSGHVHQSSQMSNVSGYGNMNPYGGHSQYPSVSHSQYPSATSGVAPGTVYPLMPGAPDYYHQQQQDYQNQASALNTIIPPSRQQSPSNGQVPYGTMPRPEHFQG